MSLSLRLGALLVAVSTSWPALALGQVDPTAPLAPVAPTRSNLAVAMTVGRTVSGETDSQVVADQASTLGLALRFRLFGVEAWVEVAKTDFNDSDRIDRQIGLALYRRLGGDRLAPYLHLGGGLNVTAPFAGSDIRADQIYGEVGAGLSYPLSGRIDAIADYTLGRRWRQGTRGDDLYSRQDLMYMPVPQDESYRQIRLGLRIGF